jgi:hypothetical protein
MSLARSHAGLPALFAAACALAFGLAATMYGVRLEQTLAQVEASRLRFTLADLQADFEKSLDRGFAIDRLANAQAALEAEARQDPDILSLTVLGANGRRLFHTGEPLPPAALRQGAGFQRGPDAITAATTLTYNYGVRAGTLLVRYSNRAHDQIMRALVLRLALAATALTVLSTMAFVAGLRTLERRRAALGAQVDRAVGASRIPAGTEAELAELVDKVNQTSATALVELTAARHVVSQPEAAR